MPTRDDAWALVTEWTASESLRKLMLAVQAAVRGYARLDRENEDDWGLVALLHDFDYERFPDQHPLAGADELRRRGYPEELIQAVLGHGDHTGIPRTTDLAHAVYACDEMSGFVIAVALVRPNRSLDEVDVRAVAKKMRDKGFARQVPRDQLTKGAEEIGVEFETHVANVIEGLKTVRADLGL